MRKIVISPLLLGSSRLSGGATTLRPGGSQLSTLRGDDDVTSTAPVGGAKVRRYVTKALRKEARLQSESVKGLRCVISTLCLSLERAAPETTQSDLLFVSTSQKLRGRSLKIASTCVLNAHLERIQAQPELSCTSFSCALPSDKLSDVKLLCGGTAIRLVEEHIEDEPIKRRKPRPRLVEASAFEWDVSMRMWAKALAICDVADLVIWGRKVVDDVAHTIAISKPALRRINELKPESILDRPTFNDALVELRKLQMAVLSTTLDTDLTRLRMAVSVSAVSNAFGKLIDLDIDVEDFFDQADAEILNLFTHLAYDNLVMAGLCTEHELRFVTKKSAASLYRRAFLVKVSLGYAQLEDYYRIETFWKRIQGPNYDEPTW